MSVPYQAHSETSKAAADALDDEPGRLAEVKDCFRLFGPPGATCEEAHIRLAAMYPAWEKRHRGTVSARMTTLKDDGDICFKGTTRPTESGNPAEVWVHSDFATPAENKLTEEKLKPRNTKTARENIENVLRFLKGIESSKTLTKAWNDGLKYNQGLLTEAIDILK